MSHNYYPPTHDPAPQRQYSNSQWSPSTYGPPPIPSPVAGPSSAPPPRAGSSSSHGRPSSSHSARVGPTTRTPQRSKSAINEGRLSVAIDFGTTFSGVAYGSNRLFSGQIKQQLVWPGSYETYRKVPSCILYAQSRPEEPARVVAWGLEAKNIAPRRGMFKCEWFKLSLSAETLRQGKADLRLPPLPAGKSAVDVIADFLRCLWQYARTQIIESGGAGAMDVEGAEVLLTVPAAFDAAGCALMREAAIQAGLVQAAVAGDKTWKERLRIITEPEAAAIHASTLTSTFNLRAGHKYLICDAGGGTVDTAVYQILGRLSALEIAELAVRSGSNCGSLFVDLKFEELLRETLKDHPIHLRPPSLASFMHAFSETDKLEFHGTTEDDEAMFRFNCFEVEDCNDPSIGLEWGELAISGKVIRTQVFDPIIDQVLELLEHQLAKVTTPVDAIILVGGFAASEYLFRRVKETFSGRIGVIARPHDCDVATLQGAARYGLSSIGGKAAVSSVISPRSYCMKVKLPAEPVDHYERPNFITLNDSRMEVCTNRLSYLVEKGAVLKKGVRLRSRFCKYTKGPGDSFFHAVLYVSDGDLLYRYCDEGDVSELCRWTVDLAALPNFRHITMTGGGYVEFDLALELDSAEVRGVLLSDEGYECGRATFEFF